MRYRALDVYLGPKKRLVGRLFQYGTGSGAITRLNPEKGFWEPTQRLEHLTVEHAAKELGTVFPTPGPTVTGIQAAG